MARLPNPFDGIIQAQQERVRAQDRWREVVGLPPKPAPVPAEQPRFINLDDVPINRAPPVREEPVWNIPEGLFMMDLEAENRGAMQRAMMRDIPQPPPHPDPINRRRRMEIDWGIARPWGNGRPIHIEREENMQGEVYGEDYS